MQVLQTAEKTETIDKTNQPEIMITVKVRDKNMRYFTAPDFIIDHLNLRAFAAVYKEIMSVHCHYLAGRVPVKSGYSRVISENGDCKHAQSLGCDTRLYDLF